MYKRILVAADPSPLSKKAVAHAIGLAASTGAELVVLTVTQRYPATYMEGAIAFQAIDIAKIEKEWAEQGRSLVDRYTKQAEAKGVIARGAVAKSDLVAESIIAAATKHKADLIVMASHGRKGLKRILMGSETLNVLTQSTIPVLVLR